MVPSQYNFTFHPQMSQSACSFSGCKFLAMWCGSECSTSRRAFTKMRAHEVLGVPLGATADVVRAAYKRAALESHPDKGGSKDLARLDRQ
eukprot:5320731-Amphidinium_carterae.1